MLLTFESLYAMIKINSTCDDPHECPTEYSLYFAEALN